HANRYGRYIVPLLSLSIDFYVRIFLQIYTSPHEVKRSARHSESEYNFNPTAPKVDRKCEHCGSTYHMGGPIWSDPIHSSQFISQLQKQLSDFNEQDFKTHKRMHGMLQVLSE
ncbi:unnamed protein product, partial [Oppiella nova]